jgi:hypothetical protein
LGVAVKVTLYKHSAVASVSRVIEGLKLRIAVVGEENQEKGLWLETREDKLPFYGNLSTVLGFGRSWLPGGEYDEKVMLRFEKEIFKLVPDIFELLREGDSQALASEEFKPSKLKGRVK